MSQLLDRRQFLLTSASAAAAPMALAAATSAGQATTANAPAAKMVRLNSNENPYGPGPAARAAIASATQDACRYDSGDTQRLVEALAAKEGVDKDRIVLGAGSGELLNNLALNFCTLGQMVCAWPTFGQIASFAEKFGCQVRKVPLDAELRHDLPALEAAITPNTSLVYICNPNNPSGTVVDGPRLREFCARQAAQTLVVVDEAYLDLIDEGATESMVDLVRGNANVVVLRTFSKIHGLAGLRMGYAVARADVAARLRRSQLTFLSIVALRAALASLGDAPFLARTRAALIADRQRLGSACESMGLRHAPPQGNFLFVKVGMPAEEFRNRMRQRGVEVGRPFELYTDWSRITVGTQAETTACIAAMREVLKA